MQLYAICRPSAWADTKELEAIAARSAHMGDNEMSDRVRWIRAYVIAEPDGRPGTICIHEARDPAAIREHADRVGMPGDQIDMIADTVVVRADPKGVGENITRTGKLSIPEQEGAAHRQNSVVNGGTELRRSSHGTIAGSAGA